MCLRDASVTGYMISKSCRFFLYFINGVYLCVWACCTISHSLALPISLSLSHSLSLTLSLSHSVSVYRSIMRQRNNTYSHQEMNGKQLYYRYYLLFLLLFVIIIFTCSVLFTESAVKFCEFVLFAAKVQKVIPAKLLIFSA